MIYKINKNKRNLGTEALHITKKMIEKQTNSSKMTTFIVHNLFIKVRMMY